MIPARKNTFIKLTLKLAISSTIMLALFSLMDITILQEAMQGFIASSWIYALFFIMAQTALLSWRWMVLINIGRYRMTFLESFQVTLASLIANILLITTISGIAVRIAMAYQYGASLFKSVAATVIDRLATMAGLVFLCIIFLPALGAIVEKDLFHNIGLFVSVMALVLFVLAPLLTYVLIKQMPMRNTSKNKIRSSIRYMKLLISDPGILTKTLSISIAAQICFFLSVFCITTSSNISLSFLEIMTVLPAIALVSSLPFTFGGWGLREGAFIFGLGLLGVPMEAAFAVSVQIGLIGLLSTIIMGLPALMTINFDIFTKKPLFSKIRK
jgi:hypothetical protein